MKNLLSILSVIVLLFSLTIFAIPEAEARFSGGHSSAGHSSSEHSSGGHSSGGHSFSSKHSFARHSSLRRHHNSYSFKNYDWYDWLIFWIQIAFIILSLYFWIKEKQVSKTVVIKKPDVKRVVNDNKLATFKKIDANFSRILFLDFVHLLYIKYYSYYGKKEFDTLTPYLSDYARHDKKLDLLINQNVIVISEVVINSVAIQSIDTENNQDRIVVEIESNYTVHPQNSDQQYSRYTNTERWFFQREQGVLSLSPEKMQTLLCPACNRHLS